MFILNVITQTVPGRNGWLVLADNLWGAGGTGLSRAGNFIAPILREGNAQVIRTGFGKALLAGITNLNLKAIGAACGALGPAGWLSVGLSGGAVLLFAKLLTDTYHHCNDADHRRSLEPIKDVGFFVFQLVPIACGVGAAVKFASNFKAGLHGMLACLGIFFASKFVMWRQDVSNAVNTGNFPTPIHHVTNLFRNPGTPGYMV